MSARREFALGALAFAAALLFLETGIRVGPDRDSPLFFIDEAHKLGETYYWHLFAEQRDVANPDWTGDFYARTNPPVAKYLYGASLALAGVHVRDRQLQADFESYWRQSAELRKRVPDAMLRVARRTSAAFAAATCALLFVIGRRAGGTLVGAGAVLLFVGHQMVQQQARLGVTDGVLMFFMAAIAPATLLAARSLREHVRVPGRQGAGAWLRLLLSSVALPGVLIALAAGTKLTGALGAVVYAPCVVLALLSMDSQVSRTRRIGLALLAVALTGAVAVAFFVAIDPYYYHDPVSRLLGTLRTYRDWTQVQQVDPGIGLFGLRERMAVVGQFGLRSATLPLAEILGRPGMWLTTLGFSAGLVGLIGRAYRGLRAGDPDPAIVLLWTAVCLVGITGWLPLTWERYLLLPYLAICLVTAAGLVELVRGAWAAAVALGSRRLPAGWIAAAGLTVALWLVVTFTSWVIAPELVHPSASIVVDSRRQREWYLDALWRSRVDSVELLRNRALVLAHAGRHDEALPLLEKALERLSRERAAPVRQAVLLREIARSQQALGDDAAASASLRERASALRVLAAAMVSDETSIRAAYEAQIHHDEGSGD